MRVLTVPQTAEWLKAKPPTVFRLIRNEALRAFRLGHSYRIRVTDLQELFDTQAPLLNAHQVGVQLSIHPETVKRYCREGKIGSVHVAGPRQIRFRQEDVDEFLQGLSGPIRRGPKGS